MNDVDDEQEDGLDNIAPDRDEDATCDMANPWRQFPEFEFGRPGQGELDLVTTVLPIEKVLLGKYRVSHPDNHDTTWIYPWQLFFALRAYFSGLKWSQSNIGLAVSLHELVFDFEAWSGLTVGNNKTPDPKSMETKTHIFSWAIKRVAAIIRTTTLVPHAKFSKCTSVLSPLWLPPCAGFDARPIFRCRAYVEAALLQKAVSWGPGRAAPQAWQWLPDIRRPSPVWREHFDEEGAVCEKPSIATRAAICSDRRKREEEERRLAHNVLAEANGRHVIAPWPVVDAALGLTGRDKEYAQNKLRITCERCPVTVSYAVRWRGFAVQHCGSWD